MKVERLQLYEDRPDVTLTTYILDDSPEMIPGQKRPAVLVCPGGGYIFCSDREAEPVALRFAAMGYIDDAAYARARTSSLLRRGYGPRRIAQALGAAGIDEEVRAAERAGEAEERRAALAFARRRGFGPFGEKLPDRAQREKQLAAMLRAGHRLDSARELVDAPDLSTVEAWASEKDDGE